MSERIKVCHMTSIHPRYDARIFLKQCCSLSMFGYDVTLVVNDDSDDEILQGVSIISTGFTPKNRIDRFLNSSKKVYEKALEVDADIYQFHDPDLMKVGIKLLKKGKKVIYDMHENVPIDIAYKEWIPTLLRKPISYAMILYEKKYVPRYTAVFTVTPHIVDRVEKINKSTFLITNYPIIDVANYHTSVDTRICNLCFAGTIVKQWQHIELLEAIKDLDDVHYLLAGSADDHYIDLLKKKEAWKNVKYYGKISRVEVKLLYAESSIGIALLKYSPTTGGKIGTLGNTKLFEYMEQGLPVICSASETWSAIVKKYACGICVDPLNVQEIRSAIEFMMQNREKAKEMGVNGRRAVEAEYNWENVSRNLRSIYENISR